MTQQCNRQVHRFECDVCFFIYPIQNIIFFCHFTHIHRKPGVRRKKPLKINELDKNNNKCNQVNVAVGHVLHVTISEKLKI